MTDDPARGAAAATRSRWLPLAAVASLLFFGFLWSLGGERIPAGQGCGFDGAAVYAPLAANFTAAVRHVSRERVQRVLPSLVVHVALRALDVDDRGLRVIALAFSILNLALLALGLGLWDRVCDALGLSVRGRWLATGAVFVSFGALKMPFYYPVLTDTAGLVLSIAALLAYLRGSAAALALVLGLSALTWPTLTFSGALLLAFPRRASPNPEAGRPTAGTVALALVPALVIGACAVRNAYFAGAVVGSPGELPLHRPTLPVSILGVTGWLFLAAVWLLASPLVVQPRALWARLSFAGAAGSALAIAAWQGLLAATGLPAGRSVVELMLLAPDSATTRSVRLPLLFVVAHAIYFGPVVLLAAAHVRAVSQEAWTHGLGMVAFLLLGVVSAITTESRHVLHVVPFVAALTAAALDRRGRIGRLELAMILGVGLAASRVWMPMGAAVGDARRALARYMAQMGPWMPADVYVGHGVVCLVLFAAFVWSRRRADARESVSA